MRILYGERTEVSQETEQLLKKGAELCLRQEELDPEHGEISLTFVDKDEMRRLNNQYRKVDNHTDVLSFPLIEDFNELDQEREFLLGDVVICPGKVQEQAAEYGHSQQRELVYLFVHSVLHLLGYDHMEEADKVEMRGVEEVVMELLSMGDETKRNQGLYDLAKKASANAYAPFSGFSVGAALLAESGKIYTGVNVENSSYGATICAERTAFVKAISEGERRFTAIAVAAEPAEAVPCGICRQFMYEFAPEIQVITGKNRDHLQSRPLRELLVDGFRLEPDHTQKKEV